MEERKSGTDKLPIQTKRTDNGGQRKPALWNVCMSGQQGTIHLLLIGNRA